jgi:glycosyltransferase involved in cell wall biosynthesis
MQRFAHVLLGLSEHGWAVELLPPPVRLGRLRPAKHGAGKWLGYFDKFVLFPRELGRRLHAGRRPALVHVCDHSNAMYVRQLEAIPHVVTCHDVLAIRSALGHFPQNPVRATGRRLQALILAGLRRAQHLACHSRETQRQLLDLGRFEPSRVSFVPIGLNYPYRPMAASERAVVFQEQENLRLLQGRRYVLHVGANQWYKNRAGAVRIYHHYIRQNPAGPDLVMAGATPPPELLQTVAAAGLAGRVHFVGAVSDVGLNALYSGAECLLFPSLQEGFGWPVLEAMAAGTRVITTRRPPMTEIGGAAAAYLDPEDEAGAGVQLGQLLAEAEPARAARIAAGLVQAGQFSTRDMLAGYSTLFHKIIRDS